MVEKERPKSGPGPFFNVQSNLSSWRRRVKTNIVFLSAALTEHTELVKRAQPTHATRLEHNEEDD